MPESLRLIKKYPNRRLYDTQTSAYITLNDVKGLVLSHERFKVADAKTGDDLTRTILLQIVVEEEAAGVPLLTTDLLVQMIRFHGNSMQTMMLTFMDQNKQRVDQMQTQPPALVYEDAAKPNSSGQ
jgi:polyhydroxyalkanoate synthesis repressor PhaR